MAAVIIIVIKIIKQFRYVILVCFENKQLIASFKLNII